MAGSVVRVSARCVDASKCPFAETAVSFELGPGDVVWLQGPSGVGKSTIAAEVAGLGARRGALEKSLGVSVAVDWAAGVPVAERCGAMFQQTTLVDALSVEGNVRCALAAAAKPAGDAVAEAKRLVEAVGLDWARDRRKMPQELSGGMARRASLALQLAQRKRVVVLDEPFTARWPGADAAPAAGGLAALLLGDARSGTAYEFGPRARAKLADYLCFSLPLILLAFAAAGVAIAMLSADLLSRLDVSQQVDAVLDAEVLPLVDSLLKDASTMQKTMTKMMVKTKARLMVSTALPRAKRALYAIGIAKLFTIELGPLLAALLLSGRVGGSYAGEVATMQATSQNKLLRTLGISPRRFTLAPALLAALAAAPVLTALGSGLAIALGGPIGEAYGIGDADDAAWYWAAARDALTPPLRCDRAWPLRRNAVELATWPLFHNALKSMTYMALIIAVAELIARARNIAPRDVPRAITASVVAGGLAVILGDWAFSQLLLLREGELV
ncbi:ABC transporter [Aureococcus anophagefferens]|uniref:ABC transporter n=1 Tax=Aureococcus anophagefferens TaxID=44056 RepID=A0ABR1FUF8_AURAN